ncbi:glycosyltransferase family 1 protein [filamentous cyanobacterium CCP1]|nr:glycosyltransferase family 1 protein [filamentous cyanobacterium CCP2]PSB57498.1 glycosyltransferase family 1 protein [filamentous cyanobacterium CCP1]
MKLLIISHPCATPVNQQLYAEVEQITGWELTIVTPSNWKNEYGKVLHPERWQDYQGKLISIPVWNTGNIPLHLYRSPFIPLLQELQPDVVYVHHEPYALATAQVYFANHFSIQRPIGFYSAQNVFKSYPFPFRQIEQRIFRESAFAFPVSHSVEEVLSKKGFARSTILPLGIDPSVYCPHPDAAKISHSLKAAPDEVLIGYLGRISEEKGLRTLLHALKEIEALSWRLIVGGAGPYEAEFHTIAQSLQLTSRICSLGFIPHAEAPRYLSAFDLLVLPSETRSHWKEQFGRVVIEAIGCGTPVIGSDSGEIPYLIQSTNGGLIFPEGNSAALADGLKTLILNPKLRETLIHQSRPRVLHDYPHCSIAHRFIQTLESVVHS